MDLAIAQDWRVRLKSEFDAPYMHKLQDFIEFEIQNKKIIYPKVDDIYSAFNSVLYDDVKVVILGQDPYHRPDQAHGLCFSVLPGVNPPSSLKNIYKELETDVGFKPVKHGYLKSWAEQGVLLLNSVLTVEKASPGSHQGKGWETFTDRVIELLNKRSQTIVFALWGNHAQNKGQIIDSTKHVVLSAAHPSPFSAYRGFFGCRHFSKINESLVSRGLTPINWQLPKEVAI